MPYPNEHSFRLKSPSKYIRFRRENDKFGNGIDAIWGITKEEKVELQAIRFNKDKWTFVKAKKWIKDHDYKPILSEPASNKENGGKDMTIKHKSFNFEVKETKEIERDGQKFGIIEGYASTYGDIDRVNDRVMPGAFADSLNEYRGKSRPIRMYYMHDRHELIGGWPVNSITDDEKGLFVVGEVNLEVQRGKETYALAKQGVLSDLSIGYSIKESNEEKNDEFGYITNLEKLKLWEISPVGEPANENANITSVKNIEDLISIKEIEDYLREFNISKKQSMTIISKIKSLCDKEKEIVKDDLCDKDHKKADLYNEINSNVDSLLNLIKGESL